MVIHISRLAYRLANRGQADVPSDFLTTRAEQVMLPRLESQASIERTAERIQMIRHTMLGSLLLSVLSATAAFGDSETPPPGPPWKRDFYDAQREALRGGKPIFIYFTKTY